VRPARIEPGPGQESVWDYPRPPRVERARRRIRVELAGVTVADTMGAYRVLETSQAPAYYLPPDDVLEGALVPVARQSWCEWKGAASYFTVVAGDREEEAAAWTYRDPFPSFAAIRDHVAFYPARMDACYVDDELAQPMPGGFYGGWVTSHVVGPFKGAPGTMGW
jgi:uncharacterized protein (DUF427 family)